MSRIRSKDTTPEINFRKYIWQKGVRGYRLNYKIKGKPDLYFPRKKIAVFIDGCFWHQCPDCFQKPATNKKYWKEKIQRNIERDLETDIFLKNIGISVLRLWEHEVKNEISLCYRKLKKLL